MAITAPSERARALSKYSGQALAGEHRVGYLHQLLAAPAKRPPVEARAQRFLRGEDDFSADISEEDPSACKQHQLAVGGRNQNVDSVPLAKLVDNLGLRVSAYMDRQPSILVNQV